MLLMGRRKEDREERRENREERREESILTLQIDRCRGELIGVGAKNFSPLHQILTPHSSLLTSHSSLLTPHFSLLTPHFFHSAGSD